MNHSENHRRSRTVALGDRARHGGRGIGRRAQSQLPMRVCVRIPVIQLQRIAEIRFASIDINASAPNPKRPMHEDVHSYT
ncbi:MAG: hypothetical protein JOZ35_04065 [Hyphomicrobiales bacterium]|nr:hypothetical protein [Hyphomicrobiales bacterium]